MIHRFLDSLYSWMIRIAGLSFSGTVTTVTDVNNFTCSGLKGLGDDFFRLGWRIRCSWDAGGAGAAPQGEYALSTDYVSATGAFVHNAFTATLVVGDKITLIHPILYEILTIRGGTKTLQDLWDWMVGNLDIARSGQSGTTTMTGAVQTLYTEDGGGHIMEFNGGYIDWTAVANFGAGENTTITLDLITQPGGAWVNDYTETFLALALPAPLLTAVPRSNTSQCTPCILKNVYGVRIRAVQALIGGGWNDIVLEIIDSKRGG